MAKNWALVIGINEYNPVNFRPLQYARQDAERVRDFFKSVGFEVCFFAKDAPPLILPDGQFETQPTYGNLITFLQDRFESPFLSIGDNCWFFFAGHGERHQDRDYLMPMDANSRGSKIIAGLEVNEIQGYLSRCGADNVIMILDACRSEGNRDSSGIGRDTQNGIITFSSCQPTQKAWEIEELEQGAFTYAFLEAMQLSGERSCATVERLSDYLKQRVPALCKQYGKAPAQEPRIKVDPIEKQHFILIPKYARQSDINQLKLDIFRLKSTNLALAEQICIRLNAQAMGQDLEVLDMLLDIRNEIRNKPSQGLGDTSKKVDDSSLTRSNSNRIDFNDRQLKSEDFIGLSVSNKSLISAGEESIQAYPSLQSSLKKLNFEVISNDSQGKILLRESGQAYILTEALNDDINLELAFIPKGEFLMGATERISLNELPEHRVEVQTFLIGRYPVTQEQWKIISSMPKVDRELKKLPSRKGGRKHPVVEITWEDANEFCKRLSKFTKRIYRLPNEAEWEYACRAGTRTPYHFGNAITTDLANYDGNYPCRSDLKGVFRNKTTPVEEFCNPNSFGIFDMHGNVWEWCADDWHNDYTNAPCDGRVWRDKDINPSKVMRGGSWISEAMKCRSACRQRGNINYKFPDTGFRVVCELKNLEKLNK